MKERFYTGSSNGYWKQCKYCGAFCQLRIDGKDTGREMSHHGDCAVLAYESLSNIAHDLVDWYVAHSNNEPGMLEQIRRMEVAIR